MSPSPPSSLLVFTTSQTPLAPRYPRPHKPSLLLPPLVHRSLHNALDATPPSLLVSSTFPSAHESQDRPDDESGPRPRGNPTLVIPHPSDLIRHDLPSRSPPPPPTQPSFPSTGPRPPSDPLLDAQPPSTPQVPSNTSTDLETEVTVKLHLVGSSPPAQRARWVTEALDVLHTYKGLGAVDNLLVGWKGVDYKGKKSAFGEMWGCGAEGLEDGMGSELVEEAVEMEVLEIWDRLGALVKSSAGGGVHGEGLRKVDGGGRLPSAPMDGTHSGAAGEDGHMMEDSFGRYDVGCLGTLYAPLDLLKKLSERTVAPKINAMDTPDCHHLPQEYSQFARAMGIELWAGGGGEGADPIPSADLHNLLQEFVAILGDSADGAKKGRLGELIPLREDGLKYAEGDRGVDIRWVMSYTLLSKTRNVVKDKGYIVSADIL